MVGKGIRAAQYGWLRVGEGSRPKFVISEDQVHRVRLTRTDENGFLYARCSHVGCSYRISGITDFRELEKLARQHVEEAPRSRRKKKK
jgi:SLT domain-containing protein